MIRKYFLPLLALVCVIACNEKQPDQDPIIGSPVTDIKKDSAGVANAALLDTTGKVQTLSLDTNLRTTSLAGLNPAHGEPGHRCDISVGAPLNSAPSKPTAQTVTPTAAPTVATATPTPAPATKTAPGMNPAHGQPGHRCDIAVGAALSSAPAKTTTTTTPVVTPAGLATPVTKEQLLKQENKSTNDLQPDNTKPVLQTAPPIEKKDRK